MFLFSLFLYILNILQWRIILFISCWKFRKNGKVKGLEISHDFSLVIPGNFTSFLINPGGFTCFFETLGYSMPSTLYSHHVWIFSEIAHFRKKKVKLENLLELGSNMFIFVKLYQLFYFYVKFQAPISIITNFQLEVHFCGTFLHARMRPKTSRLS